MRFGIISDVHANLHALDAAVAALRGAGVDRWACAGDIVGYGPLPNECVERIADLGAVCVAGNHDLVAVGALGLETCGRLGRDSLAWTREILTDDARDFLRELPRSLSLSPETVLCHGSLDDPTEYILRPRQALEQLEELRARSPDSHVLILGHTHTAWAFDADRGTIGIGAPVALGGRMSCLLNPGSVGQSREREPWARCLLLDGERRSASFFAVGYEVEACRRELARRGRPPGSCHVPPPSLFARGRRRLGRLINR